MQRKGQAAMEFLMTYGWAILAAVIAIGVLAYFGVFNPGRFMPKACTLAAPLGCADSKISATNISLVIRNGAGEEMEIREISITNCNMTNPVSINMSTGNTTGVYELICGSSLSGKFRGDITVKYKRTDTTFVETSTGTISGKVE